MQEPVAQGLWFGFGRSLSWAAADRAGAGRGGQEAVSHAVLMAKSRGERAEAGVFPAADAVLDPGVGAVGGGELRELADAGGGIGYEGCGASRRLLRTGPARRRGGAVRGARRSGCRRVAGQGRQGLRAAARSARPRAPPGPSTGRARSRGPRRGRRERGAPGSGREPSPRLPGLPGTPEPGRGVRARPVPSRRSRPAGARAAGGQLIQPPRETVAGPGTVAGDHQPPPVPARNRGDRRVQHGGGDQRWCLLPAEPGRSIPASASAVLSQ